MGWVVGTCLSRPSVPYTHMSCPSGCACAPNDLSFTSYTDGVAQPTLVLYESSTQGSLALTSPSWPTSEAALEAYINGPPTSTYMRVLPLSAPGNCCTGVVSNADYGSTLPHFEPSFTIAADDDPFPMNHLFRWFPLHDAIR